MDKETDIINLVKPVYGHYGWIYRDNTYSSGANKHDGVDISGNYLYPFVSVAEGVVENIRIYGDSKNSSMIIKHMPLFIHSSRLPENTADTKRNLISHYVHARLFIPDVGDPVKQGEVIGFTGGLKGDMFAGNTNAPHLHFGIGFANLIQDSNKPNYGEQSDLIGGKSATSLGSAGAYVRPEDWLDSKLDLPKNIIFADKGKIFKYKGKGWKSPAKWYSADKPLINKNERDEKPDYVNSFLDLSKNIIHWEDFAIDKNSFKLAKFLAKLTALTTKDGNNLFVTNAAKLKNGSGLLEKKKNKSDDNEGIKGVSSYDINKIHDDFKIFVNNPLVEGKMKPNYINVKKGKEYSFKLNNSYNHNFDSDAFLFAENFIKKQSLNILHIKAGGKEYTLDSSKIFDIIDKYLNRSGSSVLNIIIPLLQSSIIDFPTRIYNYFYLPYNQFSILGFNLKWIDDTREKLKMCIPEFNNFIVNIQKDYYIFEANKEEGNIFHPKYINDPDYRFLLIKCVDLINYYSDDKKNSLNLFFQHLISGKKDNIPVTIMNNLGYQIYPSINSFEFILGGLEPISVPPIRRRKKPAPGDSIPNSVDKLPPSLNTNTLTTPYELSNSPSPSHKKPSKSSIPSYSSSSSPSSTNFDLFSQDFKFDAPQAPKRQSQPIGGSASSGSSGGGSKGQAIVTGLDNISKEKDSKKPDFGKMIQDFFKAQAGGESAGAAPGGESGGGSSGGSVSSSSENSSDNTKSVKEKGKQDFKNILQNMPFFNKDASSKKNDDKKQKTPNFANFIKSAPSQPKKSKDKEKSSNLPSFIGPPKLNFAQPQMPSAPSAGGAGGKVPDFGSSAPKPPSSQANKPVSPNSKQKPQMPPMPSLQPPTPPKSQKPVANTASPASSATSSPASSVPEDKGQKKGEDKGLAQALDGKNAEKAKAQFAPKIVDLPNIYAKNKSVSDKGEDFIGPRMPGTGAMESALPQPMTVPDFERGAMTGKPSRRSEKMAPKIINRTIKEPDVKLTIRKPPKVDDAIEFARKLGNEQFIESMRMQ